MRHSNVDRCSLSLHLSAPNVEFGLPITTCGRACFVSLPMLCRRSTAATHHHRDRHADKKHRHAIAADAQVDCHHHRRCADNNVARASLRKDSADAEFVCYCAHYCPLLRQLKNSAGIVANTSENPAMHLHNKHCASCTIKQASLDDSLRKCQETRRVIQIHTFPRYTPGRVCNTHL